MSFHPYRERDYAFGRTIMTLRTSMNLTQVELARTLKISRIAMQSWETGSSYPKVKHLKHFIELAHQLRAFAAGREEEEIHALWRAAHQKVLLDEHWLSTLLSQAYQSPPAVPTTANVVSGLPGHEPGQVYWDDALDVPSFYGRGSELATLERWIAQEHCRVVSVLGMGGIGKSALVVTLMHRVAEHFKVVLFRSLRDAPSYEVFLLDCLQVLCPPSQQLLTEIPTSLPGRLSLLLKCLREQRVLLVLDNLEALLQEGDIRGHYHPGYEGYGYLLQRVGETKHQSCLLLTSREEPAHLAVQQSMHSSVVRMLHLAGLDAVTCKQLLFEKGVIGTPWDYARLIEAYAGNPLALKVVAETIIDLFDGAISPFLKQDTVIFSGIEDLLDEQVARLSALEHTLLRSLAIGREPLGLEELFALPVTPLPQGQVLAAVDALRRRSLIERGKLPGSVTLQSVVLEYVTGLLIEEMSSEIKQSRLSRLIEHGLCLATAREDVRQTQERLIIAPILSRLFTEYPGRGEVEEHLLALLAQLRERAEDAQGYGPANLVVLLRALRGHLRGLDLSHLALRGLHLQGVEMQGTSLAGATLHDTYFTESLDATWKVIISGDGQYWAAGGRRGEVRVWREGGRTLHLLWQAHTDIVMALAFSPDGCQLASGSLDGTVTLWKLEGGTPLWTVEHTTCVNLAFSPKGGMLASSSADDVMVRLWDAASGTLLETLPHPAPVFSLAWSLNGGLLASGCASGGIQVWQMQNLQLTTCVAHLTGHTHLVWGLAFAPDGTRLSSGSWDRTVRLWDVERGRCLHVLEGHTQRVHTVAWSPDGRTVASTGLDTSIWLWDAQQGISRVVLQGHSAPVYGLAFTPDSQSLLSSGEDGSLRVWNIASGQCVRIVQGYAVGLSDVSWNPDSTQLASAGSDMLVTVWGVTDALPLRVLHGHRWCVYGVAWSPDGKTLASSGWDNAVRLWDPNTGRCIQVLADFENVDNAFYGVAWSPDGRWLVSGSYQHGVQMWDTTRYIPRWANHDLFTVIRRVAWSPDGTLLAGGADEGSLYLWDTSDGTRLSKLQGHRGMVTCVKWSPDGSRLASGGGSGGSGDVFLWDVHRRECLHTFIDIPSKVLSLSWSAHGDLLVTGGSDGTLRWWDVAGGECVRMCEGHQGAVQSLRISRDGRLASCGDDGAIKLWDLEQAKLLQTLRRARPYERLTITGVKGLTEAQKATLHALGAIEESIGAL